MSELLADFMSQAELARELGLTVRALESWRHQRTGPPYVRIGKTPMYRRAGVVEWLRATERHPMPRRPEDCGTLLDAG